MRALAMSVAALCLSDCTRPSQPTSEFLLPETIPVLAADEWRVDTASASLSVVGHVTPSSVGRVAAVAMHPSGRLAIYDRSNCSVHVLAPAGAEVQSFGRCGDGPGDISKDVVSLHFVGDTLLLVNSSPALLIWVDPRGRELRRVLLAERGTSIADIAIVDDTTVAVARVPLSSSNEPLVALVDPRTGSVRRRALTMPAVVTANPNPAGEYVALCTTGGPSARRIFAMQHWLLQTVALSTDSLRVVDSWFTKHDQDGGVAPTFPGRPVGHLRSRFRATSIACSAVGIAMWARTTDWESVPPRDLASLLEIRDLAGRVMYRGGNPTGVHPLAKLVGAHGTWLVFASNEELPEIWVVTLGGG